MLVNCPACAKQLNVPDSAAGKKAKCPGCSKVFDIAAPTAVVAAPLAPTPPPTPRRDDDDEDRPRRRPRDDDDDEDDRPRGKRRRDDDDDDEAPRGKRRPDDDEDDDAPRSKRRGRDDDELDELDVVDDEDERPSRRRGGGGSVKELAGTVAWWLTLASFMLIGYFVISLINSYVDASAKIGRARELVIGGGFPKGFPPEMPKGNMDFRMNIPLVVVPPMTALLFTLLGGLVVYGPCVTFMFIGAVKAPQLTGRGLVLTGLIIAIVLGSLGAIGVIVEIVGFTLFFQFFGVIHVLAGLATATVLLLGGIKGVSIMGRPAMKEAFGVDDRPRRGRGRGRVDRDEDDDDDRDDRRRRRSRDDDD